MNHPLDQKGIAFYGLGFDDSTNTFKMVFFTIANEREEACAMVHVFGTRSWRQISQISLNPMIFTRPPNFPKGALFACGCLHWQDGYGKLIRLDMRTEEFGLEVWVLKQREWVIHCWFDHKPPLPAYTSIAVIGCWNRDGDIVMETNTKGVRTQLFVYCRKSDLLKEIKFVGKLKDYPWH
ncbi:hypothetical protein Hdeb2414_s0013g00418241 [Helianthus debilis subsp. tardiflorus]